MPALGSDRNRLPTPLPANSQMIDLHAHLLPGIDDGAPDLKTALQMARIAVADGITLMACTPHIYPGLYDNEGSDIRLAVAELQSALEAAGIRLKIVPGADTHLAPDLVPRLSAGRIPTLGGSRYFLLEPPHHSVPPRIDAVVFELLAAGYVPIITHPERLAWIEDHYDNILDLVRRGAWLQVTAGSLTGRFGPLARYWGERLLDEGQVHILATDAHGTDRRPPLLAEGRRAAERWVDSVESWRMVAGRPLGILNNEPPESLLAGNLCGDLPPPTAWRVPRLRRWLAWH